MRFEDFVLQFDTSSRGGFRARVLRSPFGEGMVGFSLPPVAGVEPALPAASGTSRDLSHHGATVVQGGRPPLDVGAELYRSVFQGQVRMLLDKSRGQIEKSPDLGLRLKIKIDPGDEETGALADLPWELLCDETEDFFALSRQTSLVRYLDVPRPSQPIPFTPPLRILAVGASPYGLQPLDIEEEMGRLEELNRSSAGVDVQILAHASAGAVREALAGDTYNVLHFMGHGTFDRASGEGMLAFEGSNGSLDLVSGKAFATKLRDLRSLGVVVLNACNTARARQEGGANPFRGVATALVLGGVPAVVAMQRPISDRAAIGFSTAFYRHLARGDSIDEALTEGRQAIHSAKPEEFEWATPVLFLRMPEGNVFVAKPAERTEVVPLPPLEEKGSSLSTPAPVSSSRGSALKIAAGAAGAGLVIFGLYTKLHSPLAAPVPGNGQASSEIQKPLTEPSTSGPQPRRKADGDPIQIPKTNKGLSKATEEKRTTLDPKPPDSTPAKSSLPAPMPDLVKPAGPDVTEAPTADLSSLSARLVSIERRDGGLRVMVSFKNAADSPLKVVLDVESSVLTDDQGERYEIIGSDLPSVGSNRRLDLAAGVSSLHALNFQTPRLHSKKFDLILSAQDDRLIKVMGSPITLEGSP